MKLTRKITTLESFLQEHASTDQAYQIVNFINEHLKTIEKPKPEKHRYYKSMLTAKGNILSALLNQTIMKLLSAIRQIRELDGMDTKTWFNGAWLTIPQQVYDFFNYLTYEMATLMGVLEKKLYDTLAQCCFATMSQLITHIKKKTDKIVLYFDQESGWVQT